MYSSKEQSPIVLPSQGCSTNQSAVDEEQDKTSKWECTAYDKNFQSTLCYDKSCQCVHMQPLKPAMKSSNMWLAKPTVLQSNYKKIENQVKQESVCDDKNCQSTKSAKSVCDDKNCQSTQCIHKWPLKSAIKYSHMQSVELAILKSSYKKHSYEECQIRPASMYYDKKCQSTKSLCYDMNCQSARCAHMQKPAMPQSN